MAADSSVYAAIQTCRVVSTLNSSSSSIVYSASNLRSQHHAAHCASSLAMREIPTEAVIVSLASMTLLKSSVRWAHRLPAKPTERCVWKRGQRSDLPNGKSVALGVKGRSGGVGERRSLRQRQNQKLKLDQPASVGVGGLLWITVQTPLHGGVLNLLRRRYRHFPRAGAVARGVAVPSSLPIVSGAPSTPQKACEGRGWAGAGLPHSSLSQPFS